MWQKRHLLIKIHQTEMVQFLVDRRSKTFLNEAAELIECFTGGWRRFIFALQTFHADHKLVKSSNTSLTCTHRQCSANLLQTLHMYTQAPFTWYNLLSYQLSIWFDNRVNVCIHNTTCCQTHCQTGLTTGCIVYTNIQPVVKPIW